MDLQKPKPFFIGLHNEWIWEQLHGRSHTPYIPTAEDLEFARREYGDLVRLYYVDRENYEPETTEHGIPMVAIVTKSVELDLRNVGECLTKLTEIAQRPQFNKFFLGNR